MGLRQAPGERSIHLLDWKPAQFIKRLYIRPKYVQRSAPAAESAAAVVVEAMAALYGKEEPGAVIASLMAGGYLQVDETPIRYLVRMFRARVGWVTCGLTVDPKPKWSSTGRPVEAGRGPKRCSRSSKDSCSATDMWLTRVWPRSARTG